MALDFGEFVFHLCPQFVKLNPVFRTFQLTAYPCPYWGSYRRHKRRYYDS